MGEPETPDEILIRRARAWLVILAELAEVEPDECTIKISVHGGSDPREVKSLNLGELMKALDVRLGDTADALKSVVSDPDIVEFS